MTARSIFVVAVNETGVPLPYREEAALHRDMLFVRTREPHPAPNRPGNLAEKVRLAFAWIVQSCSSMKYTLKTNEDAFVRLDLLPEFCSKLPSMGLVFGRLAGAGSKTMQKLRAGPTVLPNDTLEHPPKLPYPNGCGYIVSVDIAWAIAAPAARIPPEISEDRFLGIALHYVEVSSPIRAQGEIQPLAKCVPEVLVLHYQRHPALMRRRYERALKSQDVCGEGFRPTEICVRSHGRGKAEVRCPEGTKIAAVRAASFAAVDKREGPNFPWCLEGPSGVVDHSTCRSNRSRAVAERSCVGQTSCSIAVREAFPALSGPGCQQTRTTHFIGLFICA